MESQQAFQDFMLGGRGKHSPAAASLPAKKTPTPSKKNRKASRSHGPTMKAFQGRVQEWKDLDDQLYQVLNSIVNLRNRIWWETKSLSQSNSKKAWQGNGYRSRDGSSLLLSEDIQLALSNDLLQHERMLLAARTLVSSMAQMQEAMGRRLDELYQILLDGNEESEILDQALQVYRFLGEDLYRKQLLVAKTVDSCHNGLLYIEESNQSKEGKTSLSLEEREYPNPRTVAKDCYDKWKFRGDKPLGWSMIEQFLAGKTHN